MVVQYQALCYRCPVLCYLLEKKVTVAQAAPHPSYLAMSTGKKAGGTVSSNLADGLEVEVLDGFASRLMGLLTQESGRTCLRKAALEALKHVIKVFVIVFIFFTLTIKGNRHEPFAGDGHTRTYVAIHNRR